MPRGKPFYSAVLLGWLCSGCASEIAVDTDPIAGGDPAAAGDPLQVDGGDPAASGDAAAQSDGDTETCVGWSSQDVGPVVLPGSLSCQDGSVTLSASGADIWGASDEMHIAYQSLSGDGWISARVQSLTANHDWAKAGVMIRESLDADSAHAHTLVSHGASNPLKFDWRATSGGTTTGDSGSVGSAPRYIRLVRRADTFTGYESADGLLWIAVGTHDVSMANDVVIGLTLTSHEAGASATAVFDQVVVEVGAPECFLATDCDDANVCTDDQCSIAGSCEHVNNTAPCAGGTCADGGCVAAPGEFPPEGPLRAYTVPVQSKPGYLDSYIDSNFGTRVTRITDRAVFGATSDVVTHHYSKTQPWNSNGSLIFIDAARTLLRGDTYAKVGNATFSGERRWSNTEPLVMWNVDINARQLNRIDVVPGDPVTTTRTTLVTLDEFDQLYMGPWEGNQDDNDLTIAMLGKTGTTATGLVWDLQLNTEVSRLVLPHAFDSIDWIWISPSGAYVIVQTDGAGTDIYNRDFTGYRQLIAGDGHADMGYDVAGRECLVHGQWFGWPIHVQIWSTPLDGSAATTHFNNTMYRDWSGDHVSMRARGRPGWVTMSVNENETGANQIEKHVFSLKLDGSGVIAGDEKVNQWVHTYVTNTEYDRNAFAVPNRDGTKIMFASDWDDPSGEINSYVVEMP